MILTFLLLIILIVSFLKLFRQKEYFSSKLRKNFDIYQRLRDYMYTTDYNNYGTFLKKKCDEEDLKYYDIQKNIFRDEARLNNITSLTKKQECNTLAQENCIFNRDLPSLNVKCHNNIYNLCMDSY